jgi:hypothetical protein
MSNETDPLFPKALYAFPFAVNRGATLDVSAGMTLRDYFAATALQGLCANPGTTGAGSEFSDFAKEAAGLAYIIADAMLKARIVRGITHPEEKL